uniref:uncharacterized protein zgc:193726 isoform X2 n=1 Tax=Scatophagus argus TaxID=75038 RepID=UPI001ED7E4D3|nr:uncharacterized protein zgc:193726 isoform X2 [Scatophagus argus]
MMKSVQSVALFLMMMIMMVVVVSVSAAPLLSLLNISRRDDLNIARFHLLSNKDENSTRFESHESVNNSLDDFRRISPNTTTNETSFSPFMFVLPLGKVEPSEDTGARSCVLSTCLTANLGSALQGGDEKAGGATTDPFGIGKK